MSVTGWTGGRDRRAFRVGGAIGALGGSCAGLALLFSLPVFVAVAPSLPMPGVDDSWRYGLDQASADHLAFGRAVVFTFGPLISLYSDFRVPAHDLLYLILESVVVLALCCGFAAAAHPSRRAFVVLLPLLLANLIHKDPVFFVLPLTLVLACGRRTLPPLAWAAAVTIVAAADGLLPLVKGTASVPVAFCTAVACVLLIRSRSAWAAIVPALTAATALVTWVAVGQNLHDLVPYMLNQGDVAAGYTDAMSLFGDPREIGVYLAASIAILGLWLAADGRSAAGGALAAACVAFVAFKAGFVRQDGHEIIAAASLALVGFIAFLHVPSWKTAVGAVVGLSAWAFIVHPFFDPSPAADVDRFLQALRRSSAAVADRWARPDATFAAYAASKRQVGAQSGIAARAGTADVYPADLSALLATGLDWDPRPVLQSYSAYTPALAAMNAAHLAGPQAPANLYFDVAPIDGRYPNLEDGASWPALLARYDAEAPPGRYALLTRNGRERAVTMSAPFLQRSVPFDTDVPVPSDAGPVWATFTFKPTKTGRLVSLVFKRPLLTLDVTYADGKQASYRMIAGMADGFFLSPTVETPQDFIELKSGDPGLLDTNGVRAFRLHQGTDIPFWGTSYDVTLSKVAIEPDPAARRALDAGRALGRPVAELPVGGECTIDAVGERAPGDDPILIRDGQVVIQGWAMLSTAGKIENDGVKIALTDRGGATVYTSSVKIERPDVNAAFGVNPSDQLGYWSRIDLRGPHGSYAVSVVQDGPGGPVACPSPTIELVH